MKANTYIPIGLLLLLITITGGILLSQKEETHLTNNVSSDKNVESFNNINTTDQRERGPAVIASGKQIPYENSFSTPDTKGFRKYCVNDSICFKYSTSFFACPSSLDEDTVYLMEGVTQCEGLNDAPVFVVQKIPADGETVPTPPAYTTIFLPLSFIQDQVTSDEIYGSKNNRTISCFNTKFDRVCKVTLSDGSAYSLLGSWYNQSDGVELRVSMYRNTFDAIVRLMMGDGQ